MLIKFSYLCLIDHVFWRSKTITLFFVSIKIKLTQDNNECLYKFDIQKTFV
jgi:hypothetical protein